MNIKDPLKNVSLNIVYSVHDDSQKDLILEINVGGSGWIKVADLKDPDKSRKYQEIFSITDKVKTVAKINNLKVIFSAIGNSKNDNKDVWIDFIVIQVES